MHTSGFGGDFCSSLFVTLGASQYCSLYMVILLDRHDSFV